MRRAMTAANTTVGITNEKTIMHPNSRTLHAPDTSSRQLMAGGL
jgi:hypothetical protein